MNEVNERAGSQLGRRIAERVGPGPVQSGEEAVEAGGRDQVERHVVVSADLAFERPPLVYEVPDDPTRQKIRDRASGIFDQAGRGVAHDVPGDRQSERGCGRPEAAPDAEPHSAESDRHDKEEQRCIGHIAACEKQRKLHHPVLSVPAGRNLISDAHEKDPKCPADEATGIEAHRSKA